MVDIKRLPHWLITALAALALFVVLIVASRLLVSGRVPFDTLDQDVGQFDGISYSQVEPNFLVITSLADITDPGLGVQFGSQLSSRLRALDYDRYLAVVLLRGYLAGLNLKYTIEVDRITRRDTTVVIKARLEEPPPEEGALMGGSSPYHAIRIPRTGLQNKTITFVLEINNTEVASQSRFVP